MQVKREIIIPGEDISPLLEDMDSLLDAEITGVDQRTEEGAKIKSKFPTLFKLHSLLKSEVMKEQNTFNYERIKG